MEKMCGVNWGKLSTPAHTRQYSKDSLDEENKTTKGSRVSDETIVSEDPVGQHNPQESQGSLDWIVIAAVPAIVTLPIRATRDMLQNFSCI